jgi:outer membrane lipopolysaccharide assembly protein LptE/RlpB
MKISINTKKFAAVFVSASFVLSGCGYTFRGSGTSLPPNVRKIYVADTENLSSESGLSELVTEALRTEFDRYGAVVITDNESAADAVLNSKIVDVRRDSTAVTSQTDIGVQFDTALVMDAELKQRGGPVLWRANKLSISRLSASNSDLVVTSSADFAGGNLDSSDLGQLNNREIARGQDEQVLQNLAEQFAKRAYQEAVAPEF